MSLASTAATPTGAPGFNPGRVLRLARKELRETLRDRRTIITLVVMPILVYPVLGVALKQFLVSSTVQAKPYALRIATQSQRELLLLQPLLLQGDALLDKRDSSTATSPLGGGPILGADLGASELPFGENQIFALRDNLPTTLEDLIRTNEIDLGVRLMPEEGHDGNSAERRFQLIYRPNLPLSRQAVNFVERRLRALNDEDLRSRLTKAGDDRPQRTSWRLQPVAEEQGHSFWLGTLLPLVLILMTITGAVYPAIDLTAGERERGTLEALMAAPVPRLGILIAKYVAVVTVATMTAVVNLTAMTVTLAASGKDLWAMFFGTQGSPAEAILAVLLLLVLFAMFFSAVLLLVTSFAKSFKEAQAYVVPLMVVCLAPGFMSVMPGLELNPLLSVTPLASIVLLARDVLEGDASLVWGSIAVFSTALYGGVALALAARVFGSDAILYGSEGSWSDLFRRPREFRSQASVTDALSCLAIITPLFVILSGLLAALQGIGMTAQLLASAGALLFMFIFVPVAIARWQGVRLQGGFQLHRPAPLTIVVAAVLGCTLWPLAYDLIILCQHIHRATLSAEMLAQHRPLFLERVAQFRAEPPWLVLFAMALAPAVSEEFFFRGYLLGALRGRLPAWAAIGLTGAVFGLFHAIVGGLLAVERILSSTFLGLVLGWVCWKSRSVVPGIVLHVLHNGLMLSLIYFGPSLQAWGWDAEDQSYLPLPLLILTTAAAAAAIYTMSHIGLPATVSMAAAQQPASTPRA